MTDNITKNVSKQMLKKHISIFARGSLSKGDNRLEETNHQKESENQLQSKILHSIIKFVHIYTLYNSAYKLLFLCFVHQTSMPNTPSQPDVYS